MMEEEDIETVTIEDDLEYVVEEIKARRRNPRTGCLEYFIKWEGYPDSSNTWEPIEHLKCPELIAKFNENVKAKRGRPSSQAASPKTETPISKRPKRNQFNMSAGAAELARSSVDPLLVEDDESETESILEGTDKGQEHPLAESRLQPTGFDRGLPLEKIVGSCTDESQKLWFFIKWDGLNELELVEATEIEDKAPREMCSWYRERLYYSLNNPTEAESLLLYP